MAIGGGFNINQSRSAGRPAPGRAAKGGAAKTGKAPRVQAPKAKAPRANTKGFNSPLFNPSQTLSGKSLASAAHGIADAQTAGPLSELAKQIAANNQQSAGEQKQDFGYYMQLAQAAKDSVSQSQQAQTGLNTTLQGIGAQAQQAIGTAGQAALGGTVGRMNALGLGGDSTQQIQADTAQQAGTAAQNAQTYQQFGASQGAANTAQSLSQYANTGLQGQEKIAAVAQKGQLANEPLNAKVADIQASKGSIYSTALGQLRTAERNYQVAQEGLGIKQQGQQLTAAQNATKNALTARGQTLTAQAKANALKVTSANDQANQAAKAASLAERTNNDALSQAYRQASLAAKSSGKPGGAKPISAVSQVRLYGQITHIEGLIQQAQAGGIKDDQKIRGLLKSKYSYPDTFIEAAFDLLGYGALTPQTARGLHAMGMRGGTFRGAPVKVASQRKGIGSVVSGASGGYPGLAGGSLSEGAITS